MFLFETDTKKKTIKEIKTKNLHQLKSFRFITNCAVVGCHNKLNAISSYINIYEQINERKII